jgi:flavin-dependent dehydrogenase
MISATLDLKEASRQLWDVIVVGAGPAGAFAAHQLARRKVKVLLVDKLSFPRWKVCGCCLNGQALSILQSGGMGPLVESLEGVPVQQIVLASGGRQAILPLPSEMVLSREAFDAGLIQAAKTAGTDFLPETYAHLGLAHSGSREVILRQGAQKTKALTQLVLAADGLGGRLLRTASSHDGRLDSGLRNPVSSRNRVSQAVKNSRIGAGTITTNGPTSYAEGTIFMACGAGGYVGVVRLEDGRLAVAAAFDSPLVKLAGTPGKAASAILRQAGLAPIPSLSELPWRGTPRLTRRAGKRAFCRLFVLGDAAGFVEPFTGEGIAWALASSVAVTPLAIQAIRSWDPSLEHQWIAKYQGVVARRQIVCRAAASLLRRPRLIDLLVRILSALPFLSVPVLAHLNRPPKLLRGSEA